MRYLLDTNAVIGILRGRSRSLLARYITVPRVRVCTCSPVRAELLYGSLRSAKPVENRAKQEEFLDGLLSFDFDNRAAEAYARARAEVEASSGSLGAMDYAIAAIAIANDLTVVTHNVREFSRVPNLSYDDWEA
jgi:tRNA(fMet)-specific endonuclease VapC